MAFTHKCLEICLFFLQSEDGILDSSVTGVQTCALPISRRTGATGLCEARWRCGRPFRRERDRRAGGTRGSCLPVPDTTAQCGRGAVMRVELRKRWRPLETLV